ncbi:MAG: DUF2007 domain-containing protein [Chloroflexi bacterium]|nr:DUF2007 domain-containing protein [Chloroflexota bacterium]
MDWTAVATAPDQWVAEMWRGLLHSEGIPAMIGPADAVSFLGMSPRPCQLLVPADRAGEARAILGAPEYPVE